MIKRLAVVAIIGLGAVGCSAFDRSEMLEPLDTTIVDTPGGNLEVITIPGIGDPAPRLDLDASSDFTTNPVSDYLRYGGPTNIPFFKVDDGRLVSIGVSTDGSPDVYYGFAVSIEEGQELDNVVDTALAPIEQRFPNFKRTDDVPATADGFLTSSSGSIRLREDGRRDSIGVTIVRDSRYPTIALVRFLIYLHPADETILVGEPVERFLDPLFTATGLDANNVTYLGMFAGWTTQTEWGDRLDSGPLDRGLRYGPFRAQIDLEADGTSPDQLRTKLQPVLDSDWKRNDLTVTIRPSIDNPATAQIVVELQPSGFEWAP